MSNVYGILKLKTLLEGQNIESAVAWKLSYIKPDGSEEIIEVCEFDGFKVLEEL